MRLDETFSEQCSPKVFTRERFLNGFVNAFFEIIL